MSKEEPPEELHEVELTTLRGAPARRAPFRFHVLGLEKNDPHSPPEELWLDTFKVTSFHGSEAIGQPFRFFIRLAYVRPDQNLEDHPELIPLIELRGAPACLSIYADIPEHARRFHGIIARIERLGNDGETIAFGVELVAPLWKASLHKRSKVHQKGSSKLTTQMIIEELLISNQAAEAQDWGGLKADYHKRTLCVQYRETDLAFIHRLLEEEGIWYTFDHHLEPDMAVLVFGDENARFKDLEFPDLLPDLPIAYRPDPAGRAINLGYIRSLKNSLRMQTEAVESRDYDPRSMAMWEKAESKKTLDAEIPAEYDHPVGYAIESGKALTDGSEDALDQALIERLTLVRKQAYIAQSHLLEGESDTWRLLPGKIFRIEKNPIEPDEIEYLTTRVEHEGRQNLNLVMHGGELAREGAFLGYRNRFSAIPVEGPDGERHYRMPRITPKPQNMGVQSALVVGPKQERGMVESRMVGRIRIQFHWDREGTLDERSTCWVRVSQAFAGKGMGMHFLPRVGDEVLVSFVGGDPDRPIVTGRVHNAEREPPVDLDHRDVSVIRTRPIPETGGQEHNEIRFQDKEGEEHLRIHAHRFLDLHVKEEDMTECVELGNRYAHVEKRYELVSKKNDVTVHAEDGNIVLDAKKEIVIKADEKIVLMVGASGIEITAAGVQVVPELSSNTLKAPRIEGILFGELQPVESQVPPAVVAPPIIPPIEGELPLEGPPPERGPSILPEEVPVDSQAPHPIVEALEEYDPLADPLEAPEEPPPPEEIPVHAEPATPAVAQEAAADESQPVPKEEDTPTEPEPLEARTEVPAEAEDERSLLEKAGDVAEDVGDAVVDAGKGLWEAAKEALPGVLKAGIGIGVGYIAGRMTSGMNPIARAAIAGVAGVAAYKVADSAVDAVLPADKTSEAAGKVARDKEGAKKTKENKEKEDDIWGTVAKGAVVAVGTVAAGYVARQVFGGSPMGNMVAGAIAPLGGMVAAKGYDKYQKSELKKDIGDALPDTPDWLDFSSDDKTAPDIKTTDAKTTDANTPKAGVRVAALVSSASPTGPALSQQGADAAKGAQADKTTPSYPDGGIQKPGGTGAGVPDEFKAPGGSGFTIYNNPNNDSETPKDTEDK